MKELEEEIILILLQAAEYGKDGGGLTTEQAMELFNRLRETLRGFVGYA